MEIEGEQLQGIFQPIIYIRKERYMTTYCNKPPASAKLETLTCFSDEANLCIEESEQQSFGNQNLQYVSGFEGSVVQDCDIRRDIANALNLPYESPNDILQGARCRLLKSGFVQIGSSPYYKLEDYFVRLNKDGTVQPYSDLYPSQAINTISGIRKGSMTIYPDRTRNLISDIEKDSMKTQPTSMEIPLLVFSNTDEKVGNRAYSIDDWEFPGEIKVNGKKITLENLEPVSIPIEQQLRQAGLNNIGNGVYRTNLDTANRSPESEVIAIIEKGKLVKVIHPARITILGQDEHLKSFLGEPFQFKAIEAIGKCDPSGKCTKINALVFDNKFAEVKYFLDFHFDISGRGRSFLKRAAFRVFREFSPWELGVEMSPENIDISLNGQDIDKLERKMRPSGENDKSFESSSAGFINKTESLSSVLEEDDAFVRSKGLVHKDLAYPLKYFFRLYRKFTCSEEQIRNSHDFIDVSYKGTFFRLSGETTVGCQDSPFNDGLCTRDDITITNLNNGKTVTYSAMLPYLVERYGFYEGHTPYRTSPAEIIGLFDLKGH